MIIWGKRALKYRDFYLKLMIEKLRKWIFSLQGKFILVASMCILVFTTIGSFIILSREENLYRQDIINQGKVFAEISRLMLTNMMVYNELGMMDRQDLIDYLDYFIMNLMERDRRVRYAMVLDNDGGILAHSNISESGKVYTDESLWKAVTGLEQTEISDGRFQNEPILKITAPLNIDTKRWGIIQIGLSTKEVYESIDSLRKEIIFLIILCSMISLMIISIGAKVLARPVSKLSKIMDGIKSHGDLEIENQYVELKDRRDEIGELQKSFL
ncbi:MAG: hypothetical protein AAB283_02260, partial [Planctomycetota bacterium]